MPTDKIARLRELEKKATRAKATSRDKAEFIRAVDENFHHLLAIAEAASELKREDTSPVIDSTMIRLREKQLYAALTAFEEAQ